MSTLSKEYLSACFQESLSKKSEAASATIYAAQYRLQAIEKQWREKKRERTEPPPELLPALRREIRATMRMLRELNEPRVATA